MRLKHIRHYIRLRRIASNPVEVLRFRTRQRPGISIEVRMLEGPPIVLRGGTSDTGLFRSIFVRNEYRLPIAADWTCVVDLGGNVGLFTLRAAKLASRVISVEPSTSNFEALRRNTAHLPGVIPVHAAVAGRSGTLRLYSPATSTHTGSFSTFETSQEGIEFSGFEEVTAITLDQIFERHGITHCDLLKIDVEGQEYEVLHAASDETFRRIDRIYGEYHNVAPEDPRTRIDDFIGFLRSKGYQVKLKRNRSKLNHGNFFATRSGL